MMTPSEWNSTLKWLMETDNPGIRYLAMRELAGYAPDTQEFIKAKTTAHTTGLIGKILNEMNPEGYWVEPGPGYNPKYRSTVWSLILLAQLGASAGQDQRIKKACDYFLDHALTAQGHITGTGAPSGTADCLQGNLCWALKELGCDDPRLETAFEWMARSVTGEGVAARNEKDAPLRYYAGKCGPNFACGANNNLPCAWGAVKVMLAFSKLPAKNRTPLIDRAIKQGVDFLLGIDPATAAFPTGWSSKPSQSWWKFGFPVFYVTDILQIVEALVQLGYGQDPRLENAISLIRGKKDDQWRWPLEYDYSGKTWVEFGEKKSPNKWVTLRAMRVLQAADNLVLS